MTDFTPPDCRIFIDADISETELVGLVGQLLFDDGAAEIEASIIRNEDYDSNRRRVFPSGFVYFRYYIDLYADDLPRQDQSSAVTRILQGLWDWGLPAVAACDYEETLPHSGGYKSRDVPWPA